MLRWPSRAFWSAAGRRNLVIMSAAYGIFGLSLTFQSHRWETTPAYHVLLEVFRAPAWGGLFLASSAGMGLAAWQFRHRRWLVAAALTLAFTLTAGWMMAFVVRYLTSPNTTPETWVSWAVFAYLLLIAAASADPSRHPDSPEADLRHAREALAEAAAALQRAEEAFRLSTGQPGP